MCSFSVSAGIISARVPYLQWYVIEGVAFLRYGVLIR